MNTTASKQCFERTCLFPKVYQFEGIPWQWVLLTEITELYNERLVQEHGAEVEPFRPGDLMGKWCDLFRPIIKEGYWETVDGSAKDVLLSLTADWIGMYSWKGACRSEDQYFVQYLVMDGSEKPFRIQRGCDVNRNLDATNVYVPVGWVRDVLAKFSKDKQKT